MCGSSSPNNGRQHPTKALLPCQRDLKHVVRVPDAGRNPKLFASFVEPRKESGAYQDSDSHADEYALKLRLEFVKFERSHMFVTAQTSANLTDKMVMIEGRCAVVFKNKISLMSVFVRQRNN